MVDALVTQEVRNQPFVVAGVVQPVSQASGALHWHTDPIAVTLNAGKIDDGWRLKRDLILLVEREDDGWYIISDDLFAVYGDAGSFRGAAKQYVCALIDHAEFLEREAENNPTAQPALNRIQTYLERS